MSSASFSNYYKKQLRALARDRLGLNKNASLKKIIKTLNEDTPTKFTEKNFYKKMDEFKTAEEIELRFRAEQEKQRLANIKRQETRRRTMAQRPPREPRARKSKPQPDFTTRGVWTYKINDGIGKFVSELRKNAFDGKKNIVVDVIDNGKRMRTVQIDFSKIDRFYNWWDSIGKYIFVYPGDSSIFGMFSSATLYIYEGKEFNKTQLKKVVQIFRDDDNGKCVFNPIREWAQFKYDKAFCNDNMYLYEKNEEEQSKKKPNKSTASRYGRILEKITELEAKYPNGVHQNNIDEVCNTLQIDITIEKPLCDQSYIVCKSMKKALKHFKFINTRVNHVEQFVLNDKANRTSRNTLLELKEAFTKDKKYHTYTKDSTGINRIFTIDCVHGIFQNMSDTFAEFEEATGLNNCKIDDIDDKILSEFIKEGTHYNGTRDFKLKRHLELDEEQQLFCETKFNYQIDDVYHIDMKKAYAQFKLCKYYEGFLGKITDFRKTDSIQGVGLYYIHDLIIPSGTFKTYNDTLKIYFSHNVYTSAELNFLKNKGCSFKIAYGCWGVKPIDFEFNDAMLDEKNEDGNTYYALWTGKCDSHHLTKKMWVNGDDTMASLIAETTTGKVETFENGEICVSYNKDHNYHLGHVTAFITAYQRLNVLEQLEHIDYDTVIRVCVDGIYTEKEVTVLKNAFRHKNEIEDKTFENVQGPSYISHLMEEDIDICYHLRHYGDAVERKHNAKELHLGAGGNGKTHKNLTDNGLVKMLYVAPSWKLARNKREEYKCDVSVWARLFTQNSKDPTKILHDPQQVSKIKMFYNVLLIDECSMMTEHQKLKLFELYGDMKIIFCGDLGYQLSCYDGTEMSTNGFDEVIVSNTNYRCKDSELLLLLNNLREMIKDKKNSYQINTYVKKYFEKKNRIIDVDRLKQLYKVEDMILVGTKELRDGLSELFPDLQKYYCEENTREFSNGDIIIGDKPNCKSTLRHAFTVHSIQGETAHHNLFIECNKMWDSRLFYTAISRAKTLNQIYIIDDTTIVEQANEKIKINKENEAKKREEKEKEKKEKEAAKIVKTLLKDAKKHAREEKKKEKESIKKN